MRNMYESEESRRTIKQQMLALFHKIQAKCVLVSVCICHHDHFVFPPLRKFCFCLSGLRKTAGPIFMKLGVVVNNGRGKKTFHLEWIKSQADEQMQRPGVL